MDSSEQEPIATGSEDDSLESAPTAAASPSAPEPADTPTPRQKRWQGLSKRFNVYFWLYLLLIVVAILIVLVAYITSKHESQTTTISPQNLSKQAFEKLASSSTAIGDNSQVLNIQSSAVFAGKVLARQGLEVAGNLQIGGTLALKDLTASGSTQLNSVQISKSVNVSGTTTLQGALSVAKSLQVSGDGIFNGLVSAPQITTGNLQLNGDLALAHHITTNGSLPGRTNGSALGSGGTSSVSGNDTSGTVAINTGASPAVGCFTTVNFATKFNSTPRVLLTPVGSAAAGLDYYINRSASNFSICVTTPAPASSSFSFDYFVIN